MHQFWSTVSSSWSVQSVDTIIQALIYDSSDQLVHILGKSASGGEEEGTAGNSTDFRGKEKRRLAILISLSQSFVFYLCVRDRNLEILLNKPCARFTYYGIYE